MPAAYQDQNGKWWKECSSTKQLFGPVDNLEDLSESFSKQKETSDGFCYKCRYANSLQSKSYRQKNVTELKQKEKIRYQNNCFTNKKRNKKYRSTAAGMFSKHKQRAKDRGVNFNLTVEWFKEQMKLPEFNYCAVSGVEFVEEPNHPHMRSLDRLSSSKGYSKDNFGGWVCFKYNSWKSDLTLYENALLLKYNALKAGYNPVEYMQEVMNNNSTPHLTLMKESA
jgi:hypothetical protein